MAAKLSPFHHEALLVTCTPDRQERRAVIRELGQDLYATHSDTAVLRQFMEAAIEMCPDLKNSLLPDFNAALDGIGYWRC